LVQYILHNRARDCFGDQHGRIYSSRIVYRTSGSQSSHHEKPVACYRDVQDLYSWFRIVCFGFYFPDFLSESSWLHCTATGELLIPGGLATIFMMPLVGRMLQNKIPPQVLASLGFFFFFLFTYTLGKSNLSSGESNFYFPLILRGIGLSLLFVPLTSLAFSDVQPKDYHRRQD